MHRQHQHAYAGLQRGQFAGGLQAGHPGHRDVQDRQVDLVRAGQGDGLRPVPGLGDDLEVRLTVEDQPHPSTHQRVVVRQEDSDPR